jgi:hypothetical protein
MMKYIPISSGIFCTAFAQSSNEQLIKGFIVNGPGRLPKRVMKSGRHYRKVRNNN